MGLIKDIKIDLNNAKASKISSWIESESKRLDDAHRFFELADKLGLVVDGKYCDGIPTGDESLVNEFYLLEDKLDYPDPQKI